MRYIIALALTSLPVTGLADVPYVVTDSPAVHAITTQVMGDIAAPELLLDRGADPHSFQLRPSQAASLAKADLVVWVGPALTPWLERALDGLAPETPRLTLLEDSGTDRRDFAAAEDADHDHDHDHDHSEGGIDPHAWLDPANASHWAGLIAGKLAQIDPGNAAIYSENARMAQERIARLDSELTAQLSSVKDRPFVVFHDAYGYFTDHFGLPAALALSFGDASTPGAARVAELRQKVVDQGVVCLFPEAQHDATLLEQLAEGTSAKIGQVLDPSGSTIEPGPLAYEQILLGLASAVSDCLGR